MVFFFYGWEFRKKKECLILFVILENWGVYFFLSVLFDIVFFFVVGELVDWSVYLFLVIVYFVYLEIFVFKVYFLGLNNRYLCFRIYMKEFENLIIIFISSLI